MYFHIGQDTVLRDSTVIGIFDLDNSSWSKTTRTFLNRAEREGRAVYVFDDLPKSFVLCEDGGESRVYITQLGSQVLAKRAGDEEFI